MEHGIGAHLAAKERGARHGLDNRLGGRVTLFFFFSAKLPKLDTDAGDVSEATRTNELQYIREHSVGKSLHVEIDRRRGVTRLRRREEAAATRLGLLFRSVGLARGLVLHCVRCCCCRDKLSDRGAARHGSLAVMNDQTSLG
jgi:hypothetical protein